MLLVRQRSMRIVLAVAILMDLVPIGLYAPAHGWPGIDPLRHDPGKCEAVSQKIMPKRSKKIFADKVPDLGVSLSLGA